MYVNNHFTESEGEAEDVIIRKLDELITSQSPDVVCLPAGLYTRNNWQSPPFNQLHQMHPNITLVASAGNDSKSDRSTPPRTRGRSGSAPWGRTSNTEPGLATSAAG